MNWLKRLYYISVLLMIGFSGCQDPEGSADLCEAVYGRASEEGDMAPEVRACRLGFTLAEQIQKNEISEEEAYEQCSQSYAPEVFVQTDSETSYEVVIPAQSQAKQCVCDTFLYYQPNPRGMNPIRDAYLDELELQDRIAKAHETMRKLQGELRKEKPFTWFHGASDQVDHEKIDEDWRKPFCSKSNQSFRFEILQPNGQDSWLRTTGALTQCLSACESGIEISQQQFNQSH